ncbi:hypothetical protein [Aeromonas dhakensis]|uniref:hypothetical protein n=1 Tax=Aeromonas dhakensis TaxID=196024 RepID=UPI00342C6EC3
MSQYLVEIDGASSMAQIELAISGEEVTSAKFVKASVSFHDGRITNIVTFEELPAGTRPSSPLVLIKDGDQPPTGKVIVWAGVMLVGGTNTAVKAAR